MQYASSKELEGNFFWPGYFKRKNITAPEEQCEARTVFEVQSGGDVVANSATAFGTGKCPSGPTPNSAS